MRPRARFPWSAPSALAAAAFFAAACGPSFQAVYEGDQKFEHCYALDDNPSAPMQDKSACWRDWMRSYTYGATRDRVEYAAMRHRALSRMPSLPTDEAMMEAAPGQVSKTGSAAPAPTSAFAPPPKTVGDADPPAAARAPAPAPSATVVYVAPVASSVAPPPAADCQDDCSRAWQSCRAKEAGDAAGAKKDACAKGYKACMKGCFK